MYRPTMSSSFSTNWGSRETLKRVTRCGFKPRARGDPAFSDTKSGLHKCMNCSIVAAAMPLERSRNHETIAQESFIEVQSQDCPRSTARRFDVVRAWLTPWRAYHANRHVAQAIA